MSDVTYQDLVKAQETLTQTNLAYWHQHTFLTLTWWILLAIWLIPWIVWWRLFDRAQASRLVLNGLIVAILSSLMDSMGNELKAWGYPNELVPLLPRALAFDLGMLPVAYMLLCQYFYPWKRFIWAALAAAFVLAFVGEPLTIKLGIYQPYFWKSIYSFPIYFLLAVLVKLLVQKISDRNVSR